MYLYVHAKKGHPMITFNLIPESCSKYVEQLSGIRNYFLIAPGYQLTKTSASQSYKNI